MRYRFATGLLSPRRATGAGHPARLAVVYAAATGFATVNAATTG